MAKQLTDKEEFSKRISEKRRSRADKGKVGAAISPAELRRLGKRALKSACGGLGGVVGGTLGGPPGAIAGVAAGKVAHDLAKSILSNKDLMRKLRSKMNKNSNGLTK